jgi:hypothetical protein
LRRRYEYGTSAGDLAARHPDRLAPARLSRWNVAALALIATGRPGPAAALAGTAAGLLARRLPAPAGSRVPPAASRAALAGTVVGKGVVADAAALGHLLRREWWPIGVVALCGSRRSRLARAATISMLAPVALEWVRHRPAVDPVRYAALRLLEDAAYGTGVLVGAARRRTAVPLLPVLRTRGAAHAGKARRPTSSTHDGRLD